MHISFVNRLSDKYYITNQKSTNTQNHISNNFPTNLNNLPNYSYLINFNGTNVKIIEEMVQLVKNKGYKFEDLKNLLGNMTNTVKENF